MKHGVCGLLYYHLVVRAHTLEILQSTINKGQFPIQGIQHQFTAPAVRIILCLQLQKMFRYTFEARQLHHHQSLLLPPAFPIQTLDIRCRLFNVFDIYHDCPPFSITKTIRDEQTT